VPQSSYLGFEIPGLDSGFGADIQVEYTGSTTTFYTIDMDLAATTSTAGSSGVGAVLATIAFSSSAPDFADSDPGGINLSNDSNFGAVTHEQNAQGATIESTNLLAGGLVAVPLKFPVVDGTVSSDHRHVHYDFPSGFQVASGNYFAFHMNFTSSDTSQTVDTEMQVVFTYE
jgi:hypothetical protein